MLIGISGRLRSGKDTAAAGLVGTGWYHGSFARALKDFTYALDPIVPIEDGYARLSFLVDNGGWERAKDNYPEVRKLLQRCGTDAGRKVLWDDVWVQAAMNNLPPGDVVFTDVRFPNEADAIRAAGGYVIRVERPSLPPLADDAHVSERSMDGYEFDTVLVNDGSVAFLRWQVAAFLESRPRQ